MGGIVVIVPSSSPFLHKPFQTFGQTGRQTDTNTHTYIYTQTYERESKGGRSRRKEEISVSTYEGVAYE